MTDDEAARAILRLGDPNAIHPGLIESLEWHLIREENGARIVWPQSTEALYQIARAVWLHGQLDYSRFGVLDLGNRAKVLKIIAEHLSASLRLMDLLITDS